MKHPHRGRVLLLCITLLASLFLAVGVAWADQPTGAGNGNGSNPCTPADPDGNENGGADCPGGSGGNGGDQDMNNGTGNDSDCEDDNNGNGVPGHCRDLCPLINGVQLNQSSCPPPPPVVDACPDEALNPGVQAAGTVCNTTPPPPPGGGGGTTPGGGGGSTPTGGDTPTSGETPTAGAVDTPDTPAAEADGGDPAVAGVDDSTTVPTGSAGGAPAGAELPFTGAETWLAALLGAAMLGVGAMLHKHGARIARARA